MNAVRNEQEPEENLCGHAGNLAGRRPGTGHVGG
jgi:hypothetical protein